MVCLLTIQNFMSDYHTLPYIFYWFRIWNLGKFNLRNALDCINVHYMGTRPIY